MTHDMTPTERQAAIIADLEARVTLLTDDLFYARASIARLIVDLEDANRQVAHRDAEIAMLRAASDNADDKTAERPTNKTPRTDAHVNQLAAHLVHPHWITFARELERENTALRAALERLRDCDWVITPQDRMDAVREIARKALEWKGTQP